MGLSFYRYPPIELVPSPLSNEYLKRPLGRIVISWKKSGNHHVIEKLQSDLTEVPEVDTQPPLKTERRRSSRFPAVIPVHVKWQEPTGKILKEGAQAKEVNAQGGLLDMKIYPWVGGNLGLDRRVRPGWRSSRTRHLSLPKNPTDSTPVGACAIAAD